MVRRWARLIGAVLVPLCTAAASPPSAGLPSWLLGTWDAYDVRQSKASRYVPDEDPQHWYAGAVLTVSRDRLSFADRACEKFTVHSIRGPLKHPVREIDGEGPEAFDLPNGRQPVDYLEIRCTKNFVDLGEEHGGVREMTTELTWYVVLRSRDRIEMPFFGGAYIKLRRTAAVS